MRREFLVGVTGIAIVVACLSGCSSKAGSSNAKVTIDGQDQNVKGTVACNTTGGKVNIAIGDKATGIGAVLTDANPPEVESVGLGNVNGAALGYTAGTGQGNASATKDDKKYKVSGNATGVNLSDRMHPRDRRDVPVAVDAA